MRAATYALGAGTVVAAMVFGAGPAGANVPLTVTPGTNSLTFTFRNNDYDSTRCEGYASGAVSFRTPNVVVAPRSSASVTMVEVPAGNYSITWGCRGFAQGKQFAVVSGAPLPGARPHEGTAPPPANSGSGVPPLGRLLPSGSFGSA